MTVEVEFRILDLLCGRLCHELVSPVGAINNGVELLDEDDPEFVKEALMLIGQSARKAAQRLQFYRFAYGTAGAGMGAATEGRALSAALLDGGKVQCEWTPAAAALELPWQRLGCNLLVLAAEALPRGGKVMVEPGAGGAGIAVTAEGDNINVGDEVRAALAGDIAAADVTSRTVHAFYTGHLAGHLGARLSLAVAEPVDRVRSTAVFAATPA
jgi:histidine phosphotransferase ChpT